MGRSCYIGSSLKISTALPVTAGQEREAVGERLRRGEIVEHVGQMGWLKEMIGNARNDAEQAGVSFIPIVNYPVDWAI